MIYFRALLTNSAQKKISKLSIGVYENRYCFTLSAYIQVHNSLNFFLVLQLLCYYVSSNISHAPY